MHQPPGERVVVVVVVAHGPCTWLLSLCLALALVRRQVSLRDFLLLRPEARSLVRDFLLFRPEAGGLVSRGCRGAAPSESDWSLSALARDVSVWRWSPHVALPSSGRCGPQDPVW